MFTPGWQIVNPGKLGMKGKAMSSINGDTDYKQLANQIKSNNAASLFGSGADTNVGGISGDALQQWAMLGANSKAYKSLLAAEKAGSVKQDSNSFVSQADRLYNDYFDTKTGKIKKATYTPTSNQTPEIAADKTAGDIFGDMRTLALAGVNNPNSLNSTHYDLFEKMRSSIASGFVGSASSSSTDAESKEAATASLTGKLDHKYVVDDEKFTLAGKNGEASYSFGIGTDLETIAAKINGDSGTHGINATVVTDEEGKASLKLETLSKGADQFVRVDQTAGSLFAAAGSSASAKGTDPVTSTTTTESTSDDTRAAMAGGIWTGKLFEDTAFSIQGSAGSKSFEFKKGATAEEIADAINAASTQTGVSAELIKNSKGEVEGIGLISEKAGAGHNIQVNQTKGDLFAREGKTAGVAGSSEGKTANGSSITSLQDLGKVRVGDETYSFADLAEGGKASLAKNPDAALAVLDQAMKDIYEGRAVVKGFDPASMYMDQSSVNNTGSASTNTFRYGFDDSAAIGDWLKQYKTDN